MSRFNTGNPLGSGSPLDLDDNAKNLDVLTNSREALSNPDRFGVQRKTWHSMERDYEAAQSSREAVFSDFLQASGYQDLGEYAPGIEITAHNQYVFFGGQPYLLKPSIPVPYTTSGEWTGDDFKLIGDDTLRQDLANPDMGAAMVGFKQEGEGAVERSVKAKFAEYISANDYGFDSNGTAEANRDAILAAVSAANGMNVKVYANEDYECSSLIITNSDIDLEFVGKGRMNRREGGGRALTLTYDLTNVESVSSITQESLTVDGGSTTVSVLNVGDSSAYYRGAVVRVVSEDLDPDAWGEGRRFGEVGVVISTDTNKIYLSTELEDGSSLSTDVRVGLYQERIISVKNLVTVGNEYTANGQVVVISGALRAKMDVSIWGNPWIGFAASGCALCEFEVRGRGKGDTDGSLGYLINESGGYWNTYIRPEGYFYRHLFTTNFSSVSAGSSDLFSYGGARDIVVFQGKAPACQGTPWDDHPGARRTKFLYCYTGGMLNNNSAARSAFQLRGKDTLIVEPECDGTVMGLIRPSASGQGSTHRVAGGNLKIPIFNYPSASSNIPDGDRQTVVLENVRSNIVGRPQRPLDIRGSLTVEVIGGEYSLTESTDNTRVLIAVRAGGECILKNPALRFGHTSGTSLYNRPFLLDGESYCSITGVASYERVGASGVGYTGLFYSTNPSSELRIKLFHRGEITSSISTGDFGVSKYLISRSSGDSVTNISDFDDYMANLAAI